MDDDDLTRALEQIRLPNRTNALTDNGAAYGIPTTVTLNVFKLELDKAPGKIYKYDLQFFVTKKNGKECELNNALIRVPEFIRTKKRNALVALMRMMHESDKEYFRGQQIGDANEHYWRSCCVFDCGNAYYTAVELPNHKGDIPEDVWKSSEWVTTFVSGVIGAIRWELKKVEVFRIDGEHAKSPQAMNFFSILAAQDLQRQEDVDCKKDAAYMREGELTRDHKELRKGIVTASKAVGEDICIQMDSKISMFFQEMPLLSYLMKFSGIQNPHQLGAYLMNKNESSKLRKELVNLPLRMTHLASRRIFECKGFHVHSAAETTFMLGEQVITTEEYFLERYKIRLMHPHLPLILEKKQDGNKSFHPIECLAIADGVRVSNQKMSREAQEAMISKACRAPAALSRDLEASRDKAQLTANNKYMKALNVRIKGDFSTVPARILDKPFVTGMAGIRPNIDSRGQIGFTKGPNFKFADPAKPEKPIYFLVLDSALDLTQAEKLKNVLLSASKAYGMVINFHGPADPRVMGGEREPLEQLMLRQHVGTAMFFFVTREKIDENHYTVKKLEQEIGVVTQLICQRTAMDLLSDKRVTIYNIVAKMNQKLGGVVTNPEVPPDLKTKDPDAYARAVKDWFPNRMFIGLSLSHAGAQSYADRLVGEQVKEPTCVGMAFTLRQPGKRSALSWFIEKRKPIIEDLTRHLIRALDVYAESNDRKMPTSILIFRKGMSEGELKMAAYEMNQVKEAIKQLNRERPELKEYQPTIQCLVCMANTSDRLFYQGGAENVPAGTVLEKEATNPERLEFIIVAHNAIKGTAKPVKCTLVSEMKGRFGRRLSLSELQSIYHTMCYLHGIAASPTRLPVPLSDSEQAAERQMQNYKEAMRDGDPVVMVPSGSSNYYQRLSDLFAHKFRNVQYYA